MDNETYLMHYGIKGMKWGVRRYEDASGHLTDAGKRRYAVQDARKYYKINRLQRAKESTRDPNKSERLSRRIRRVQTRSDRKHADLSKEDINTGRQIVAKNRRNMAALGTAAKAAATAAGAYALYQNPKTRALAPVALAAGGAVTFGSAKKLPYYTMEARRYKQVNPKGAVNKGLTKKQIAVRKAGKALATTALAGAAGYALVKSGAVQNMVDKYKATIPFDRAVKVANAEKKIKNAFGIKTGRQKAQEQMARENLGGSNSSGIPAGSRGPSRASADISTGNKQTYTSSKNRPSDATREILDANQRAKAIKRLESGEAGLTGTARKIAIAGNKYDQAKANARQKKIAAGNSARNAGKAISKAATTGSKKAVKSAAKGVTTRVKNAAKNKVMADYNVDDPRTWGKPVSNIKDLASNGKRYYTAAKAVKNRDAITAISTLAPELTSGTNKMIEKAKSTANKRTKKKKYK